eukprot:2864756-Amphidinium_carterae.1
MEALDAVASMDPFAWLLQAQRKSGSRKGIKWLSAVETLSKMQTCSLRLTSKVFREVVLTCQRDHTSAWELGENLLQVQIQSAVPIEEMSCYGVLSCKQDWRETLALLRSMLQKKTFPTLDPKSMCEAVAKPIGRTHWQRVSALLEQPAKEQVDAAGHVLRSGLREAAGSAS